jgi:hypothetical protein
MRCLMCEEPTTMYIPSDDVDGVGLHSCGVCGFEIEAPRDEPVRVDEHQKLTATNNDDDDGCGRPSTSLVSVNVTFTTS